MIKRNSKDRRRSGGSGGKHDEINRVDFWKIEQMPS